MNVHSFYQRMHSTHTTYMYDKSPTENRILFASMSIFLDDCLRLCVHSSPQARHPFCIEYICDEIWFDSHYIDITSQCTCMFNAVAVVDIIIITLVVFVVVEYVQTDFFLLLLLLLLLILLLDYEFLFDFSFSIINSNSVYAFDGYCYDIRFNLSWLMGRVDFDCSSSS